MGPIRNAAEALNEACYRFIRFMDKLETVGVDFELKYKGITIPLKLNVNMGDENATPSVSDDFGTG